MWKPDLILLGPGGAKGFLEVGCCKKLYEEEGFLNNVTDWVGVSAGAAICLLLVIGYTPDEIDEICMNINIIDDILSINLDQAKERLGLLKIKTVEDALNKRVRDKLDCIPTLQHLYMLTGKTYTAVTYNTDKMREEYLNRHTEPTLSCIEAALMSMSIPGFIQPRKYKGCVYVDGAIAAPYPVLQYDDGRNVLGIYISSENDNYSSDKKFSNFGYRLIQAGMKRSRDMEIKYSSKRVKHIALKTSIKDTIGISISDEDKKGMVEHGYNCAEQFLIINSNPDKYRIEEEEEIPALEESIGILTHSISNLLNTLSSNISDK